MASGSSYLWRTQKKVIDLNGSAALILTEQLRDIGIEQGEHVWAGVSGDGKRVVVERIRKS